MITLTKQRLKLILLSTYNKSRRTWILAEDFMMVPKGFKTDLASVPRLMWWFLSPTEIAEAAVVHDFLYSIKYNRKKADIILYDLCRETEGRVKSYLIYLAVRLFGWRSYYK